MDRRWLQLQCLLDAGYKIRFETAMGITEMDPAEWTYIVTKPNGEERFYIDGPLMHVLSDAFQHEDIFIIEESEGNTWTCEKLIAIWPHLLESE